MLFSYPMQVGLMIDFVAQFSLSCSCFDFAVYRWCCRVGCGTNAFFLLYWKTDALFLILYSRLVTGLTQMKHSLTLDNVFSCCNRDIRDEASCNYRTKEIGCESFYLHPTLMITIRISFYCSDMHPLYVKG